MTIIDAHCHVGKHRFEPVEVLRFQMQLNGIQRAVLVDYGAGEETDYLLRCHAQEPGRFTVAAMVSPSTPVARIHEAVERGATGIRIRAVTRAAGPDPLAQWRTAAGLGLVISLPGLPDELLSADFAEVLRRFEDLVIVIEHLAVHKAPGTALEVYRRVLDLARRPNLFIKLHGFGEICGLPPIDLARVPPFVDLALDAFGPRRTMWASDWPPVCAREGLGNALRLPLRYLDRLTSEEREWIFGRTAAKVWRLSSAVTD